MIINKELFDYCYSPDEGIIRVGLKEDKSLLPKELLDCAFELDGLEYSLVFGIDTTVDGKALIWYESAKHQDIIDIFLCDNKQDVINYFNTFADEEDLESAFADTPYEVL